MSLFRKIFKYRYLDPAVDPKKYLVVTRVNDRTNNLYESLGITQERAAYLGNMCHRAFVADGDIMTCAEQISPECTHANELYFVGVMLSTLQMRQQSPIIMMGGGFPSDGQ